MNQPNQYLDQQQQKQHGFAWGKVAGMIFTVVLPGGLLIYANQQVFPDASWLATGMVIVSIGVAVIFAVASGYATPKVKKYVLIASVLLAVELAANLACHWVLSREVSGAKQATIARHEEEDREEKRRDAEAQRQKDLLAAQTKALNAEAWRNAEARKLGMQAPRGGRISTPAVSTSPLAATSAPVTAAVPKLTVEQVMEKWLGWLILFAILDLLTSVVAFGICALVWEWDLNHDGVADHLQGRGSTIPARQAGFVQAQTERDPKAESNQD